MAKATKETAAFTGLLDLATMETDEVKAVTSRLPSEGIYIVDMARPELRESEPEPDKTPMVFISFSGVIDYYAPLKEPEEGEEIPDLIGKNFRQMHTMFMDDLARSVGELKGMLYHRAKLPTAGQFGGNAENPGWVDAIEGNRVAIRVRHGVNKREETVAYFDWLTPKQLVKVGIEWEELGRDALEPNGSVSES